MHVSPFLEHIYLALHRPFFCLILIRTHHLFQLLPDLLLLSPPVCILSSPFLGFSGFVSSHFSIFPQPTTNLKVLKCSRQSFLPTQNLNPKCSAPYLFFSLVLSPLSSPPFLPSSLNAFPLSFPSIQLHSFFTHFSSLPFFS